MTKVTLRRSMVFWTILLIFAFTLLVVLLARPAQALPLLWLDPANAVGSVGDTVDVDIRLDDVTDVYAVQLGLTFDDTILQVVGAEVTPGTCPEPLFVALNSADNVNGTIDYAVTQLAPAEPCTGGVVATITFECIAEDTSPLNFSSSIISNSEGTAIPHGSQNGTVECQLGGFDVIGTVALQSWVDPSGIAVTLFNSSGAVADGPDLVGPSGTFRLRAADVTDTYRVEASYDRYLSAEVSGIVGAVGDEFDLGSASLRAGDINGDGVINMLDLSALAGNFNKTSPQEWVTGS